MTTELDHARAVLAFAEENKLIGASILAEDLRRLIAHIERLEADAARSRETTSTEREAIADIVRFEGDDEWEIADAILASPVWRGRALGPITDEMVEAAQDAHHVFAFGPDEPPLTAREKGITRQAWRVALEAAAKAQR